jgi:hypothetical protein
MCETNPIWLGRGRLTDEIVQNKAKLAATGVYGQWCSCGPWLGRGVKRAKRTQFPAGRGPGDGGRRENVQNEPNLARLGSECAKRSQFRAGSWRPAANCAKRSQFPAGRVGRGPGGWAERQVCKTKPISPERPGMGAGRRRGRLGQTPFSPRCLRPVGRGPIGASPGRGGHVMGTGTPWHAQFVIRGGDSYDL